MRLRQNVIISVDVLILLPFALTPRYCLLLKRRIAEEEEYRQWENTMVVTSEKIVEIENTIGSSEFWESATLTQIRNIRLLITLCPHAKGLHAFPAVQQLCSCA